MIHPLMCRMNLFWQDLLQKNGALGYVDAAVFRNTAVIAVVFALQHVCFLVVRKGLY